MREVTSGMNLLGVRVNFIVNWETFGKKDEWETYVNINSKHVKCMEEEQSPRLIADSREYFNEVMETAISKKRLSRISYYDQRKLLDKAWDRLTKIINDSRPTCSAFEGYYGS